MGMEQQFVCTICGAANGSEVRRSKVRKDKWIPVRAESREEEFIHFGEPQRVFLNDDGACTYCVPPTFPEAV